MKPFHIRACVHRLNDGVAKFAIACCARIASTGLCQVVSRDEIRSSHHEALIENGESKEPIYTCYGESETGHSVRCLSDSGPIDVGVNEGPPLGIEVSTVTI
jgi:hypothetical protein